MPNIGKVEVIYNYGTVNGKEVHFEMERYQTLVISPIRAYEGVRYRFINLSINDIYSTPTPMLFLDENVSKVCITYNFLVFDDFGYVIDEIPSLGISVENYLPQLMAPILGYKSIPRGTFYKGVIFEGMTSKQPIFAYPVDLDKNEFKMELNSVLFTLRLNRSNKIKIGEFNVCLFDIIKAEFGEGLSQLYSESFVELKPKGV